MSRIGNMPISIPDGVDVSVKDNIINVKKGNESLSQEIPEGISVEIEDKEVLVERLDDSKHYRSLHGLIRSLINNMMIGLTSGFSKTLEINGVGYRVQQQGNKLVMNLGLSHPTEIEAPEGITFEVEGQNKIVVKGADKQLVGEIAAKIRSKRIPDAYKGKGIKYDYEILRLKEGKTGA
ncbi:MAG: 50S ribosomal protein L6 [Clostridiaceae bacterium]|nr:50S ribosomal protein L6 [Clostridiaceae bacterium]